jgi:hypothetical protein
MAVMPDRPAHGRPGSATTIGVPSVVMQSVAEPGQRAAALPDGLMALTEDGAMVPRAEWRRGQGHWLGASLAPTGAPTQQR